VTRELDDGCFHAAADVHHLAGGAAGIEQHPHRVVDVGEIAGRGVAEDPDATAGVIDRRHHVRHGIAIAARRIARAIHVEQSEDRVRDP
jgi:hypothetical protein